MSKYHNKKIILNRLKFTSLRECNRYCELKLLEHSGTIKDLKMQVPFVLVEKSEHGRALKYLADFVYFQDGKQVVEDVKGVRTPVYRLKKRLVAEKYGIEIREI